MFPSGGLWFLLKITLFLFQEENIVFCIILEHHDWNDIYRKHRQGFQQRRLLLNFILTEKVENIMFSDQNDWNALDTSTITWTIDRKMAFYKRKLLSVRSNGEKTKDVHQIFNKHISLDIIDAQTGFFQIPFLSKELSKHKAH